MFARRYRSSDWRDLFQEAMVAFCAAPPDHDTAGAPLLEFAIQRGVWRMMEVCRDELRHGRRFVTSADVTVALDLAGADAGPPDRLRALRSQKLERARSTLQAGTLAVWCRMAARSPEERLLSPGRAELFDRVGNALASLAPRDREILEPLLLGGRSIRELTAERGQARGTVTKQALDAARRAVEIAFAGSGDT